MKETNRTARQGGVMVNAPMSSEENDGDDGIKAHPLPWHSTRMFEGSDHYNVYSNPNANESSVHRFSFSPCTHHLHLELFLMDVGA